MIIDAKDRIVGRIATIVAKKALLGEGIVILNCDKAIITGHKRSVLENSKKDFDRGIHTKGPFIPKQTDKYVKRIIRGMLPYKQPKGRAAFERIKCHVGIPESFKDQKIEVIGKSAKGITIREICRTLGGKL